MQGNTQTYRHTDTVTQTQLHRYRHRHTDTDTATDTHKDAMHYFKSFKFFIPLKPFPLRFEAQLYPIFLYKLCVLRGQFISKPLQWCFHFGQEQVPCSVDIQTHEY